jgi:hypothetical protein
MNSRKILLAFSAVLSLTTGMVTAQTYRGAIAGSVADSSGAAVADAAVKVVNKGTGATRTQNTPPAGDFNFPDLAPGLYTLTVTRTGFQTFSEEVEAAVGKITSIPVTLGVAGQTQTVEVQAASVSLETNEAVLNAVVDTRAVEEIPLNARDFTQLLKLTSGYNDQGSMNGNRPNQNNWQIDGADNNDFWQNANAVNQGSISAVAGVLLPVDAIDQFNMQAGGNADFGRNPGSMVNVVIKSGTNALHGTAYYFNRNEALAEQSPFAPPGVNPELRNEHEGFSLGGPIWKNHTFFFLTFERQKFVQGNTVEATVPSTAWINQAETVLAKYHIPVNPVMINVYNALFPTAIQGAPGTVNNYFSGSPARYKSENGIIKIDHVFNEKHSLFARAFLGTGEAVAYAGSVYGEYYQSVPSRQPNFAVGYNYVITPKMVNQLLLGVNYFYQAFDDASHGYNLPALGFDTNVTNPANFGAPTIAISGFTNGGVGETPQLGRIDTTGHITDSLSYNLGAHALKFGGEYRKSRIDIFYQRDVRGGFTFDGTGGPWANDGSFSQPQKALADFIAGIIPQGEGNIATGDAQRVYDINSYEAWAADDWQVTPKLNINLGLRYEYNTPLAESTTNKGISTFLASSPTGLAFANKNGFGDLYPPDRNNFAPRIGFAYSPVRGGKTVIRGAWGIFYDVTNGNLFIDNRVDGAAGRGVSRNPGGPVPVYTVTNLNTETVQQGVPIFGTTAAPPFGAFSVNQQNRSPYVQNFNINVQRELSRSILLQVGYVGNQGRKLPVNLEINQPLPDPSGNLSEQQRRPYNAEFPQFAGITDLRDAGNSHYNSMQISLHNREWHGVTGQLQYTLSHAMDTMSNVRNNGPEDSYNLNLDWGNSDFDVRHVVTGYLLYDIPNFAKSMPRLGKGWQLNLLLTHQSGNPFSVITGTNVSDTFNFRDRLNLSGDPFAGVVQPQNASGNYANGYQWFNGSVFSLPAPGTFGTTKRNQFYGPHLNSTDFSVFKTTAITERVAAQFRVEIFNLFNQLNLANPDTNIDDGAGFGLINATRASAAGAPGIGPGEPRNVQLALKIIW